MRTVSDFNDYELIDATSGQRLERWGDIILIRPDPQVMWETPRCDKRWENANARYHRSASGGGYWEMIKKVPDVWSVKYNDLVFCLKPMGFKHTGLFPEQAVNWSIMAKAIKRANRPISVLNLFAYTGGATVACLKAGASVTHVDASKGMVAWAKENAAASGVSQQPVRWLVDDCMKFIQKEIRRGKKYDAIVMDPPSYGRGPNGEIWKLDNQLNELFTTVSKVLVDDPLFFILNSYTTGISPTILTYVISQSIPQINNKKIITDEIGLKITTRDMILPCGNTSYYVKGFMNE